MRWFFSRAVHIAKAMWPTQRSGTRRPSGRVKSRVATAWSALRCAYHARTPTSPTTAISTVVIPHA